VNVRIGTSLVVAGTGRVYGVPSGMYVPDGSARVRDQSSTSMTWIVKVPAKHAVLPALLGSRGPISAPLPLGGPGSARASTHAVHQATMAARKIAMRSAMDDVRIDGPPETVEPACGGGRGLSAQRQGPGGKFR
jgi:hypothetical protein